ncbi:MAG: PEP-CTERM sorting domain-containing protein [Planctomycetota bacterium]
MNPLRSVSAFAKPHHFVRAIFRRSVFFMLLSSAIASIGSGKAAAQTLDLRGQTVGFVNQTLRFDFDDIRVDSDTNILLISDSDITYRGDIRFAGSLGGVTINRTHALEGGITILGSSMLTFEADGDPRIELPKQTDVQNSVLRSAGGFLLTEKVANPSSADRGPSSLEIGGVIIGGLTRSGNTTLNESNFRINRDIDFGSVTSHLFGDTSATQVFDGKLTLNGGNVSFYRSGASKTVSILDSLSGRGTFAAAGAYSQVNVTGGNMSLGVGGNSLGVHIGQLSLASDRNLTLSGGTVRTVDGRIVYGSSIDEATLRGGRIVAGSGVTLGRASLAFDGDGMLTTGTSLLDGLIQGSVDTTSFYNVVATGDLTLGTLSNSNAVDIDGSLSIGGNRVRLLSSDRVTLRGETTIDGGQLIIDTAANDPATNGLLISEGRGIVFIDDDQFQDFGSIRGNGVIMGNVLATDRPIIAEGSLVLNQSLDVGSRNGFTLSEDTVKVSGGVFNPTEISIAGGTLRSGQTIELGRSGKIRGHGTVDAALSGIATPALATSEIIVQGGDLTIGDGTSAGFNHLGNITVGANRLILRDSTLANLGVLTTIGGGEIIAENGVSISSGDEIRGWGLVRGQVSGQGSINGTRSFGLNDLPSGLTMNDQDDVTVVSSTGFSLGSSRPNSLQLNGGTLRSSNGFSLESFSGNNSSFTLSTGTNLLGSIVGETSRANLNALGDVVIGDASRADGVKLSLTGVNRINSGSHDLVLLDSDGVEANELTVLGGSIRSESGFIARAANAQARGVGVIYGQLDPEFNLNATEQLALFEDANVGTGVATLLSTGITRLTNLQMQEGGRLKNAPGANHKFGFAGGVRESFAGTIEGSVIATNGIIETTGDLTLGDLNDPDSILMFNQSELFVNNNHRLTLLDQNEALVSAVLMDGGEIQTFNGLASNSFESAAIIGRGIVRGDINSNVRVLETLPLTRTMDLDVGTDIVTVVSNAPAHFDGADLNLNGGTIRSNNGFLFQGALTPSNITGHGVIDGSVGTVHTITAQGGDLTLGNARDSNGFQSFGLLEVGSNVVRLRDANTARITNTTLDGGTLVADNGFLLTSGATLTGHGLVRGHVLGSGTVAGTSAFSRPSVDVGDDTVTLLTSSDFANNLNITSAGGTLRSSANALTLVGNGSYTGHGIIEASFRTNSRSDVTATGQLFIGTGGGEVELNGDLHIGNHLVALVDQQRAVLGGETTISGGRLFSSNSIEVESGSQFQSPGSISGHGTIDAVTINDGEIRAIGDDSGRFLTFEEKVSGTGSYTGNVRFNSEFSPGASPAIISMEDMTLTENAFLSMELGGPIPGTGYDQLLLSGDAFLDGMLGITLLDSFEPTIFGEFEILSIEGNVTGQFIGLNEGAEFASLNDPSQFFSISYTGGDGNDIVLQTISAVPEPSMAILLLAGSAITCTRRRRK